MKKTFFLLVIISCHTLYAEQTISGGSGLFYARKAEVVDAGKYDIGAFYKFTDFRVEAGYLDRNPDNLVQVNIGYGFLGIGEVAIGIPVYFNSGYDRVSSIGDITLIGKVALPREPLGGLLKVGATLAAGLPTADKDKFLGSGKINILGEVNIGLYFHKWSTHLNLGFAEEDYYYEVKPEEGLLLKPTLVGSFGFLYNPVDVLDLVVELNGKSVRGFERGDEDLFALIGARLQLLDMLYLQVGAGVGLPTIIRKTNTDFVLNVGAGVKM